MEFFKMIKETKLHLLSLLIAASLVGCGGNSKNEDTQYPVNKTPSSNINSLLSNINNVNYKLNENENDFCGEYTPIIDTKDLSVSYVGEVNKVDQINGAKILQLAFNDVIGNMKLDEKSLFQSNNRLKICITNKNNNNLVIKENIIYYSPDLKTIDKDFLYVKHMVVHKIQDLLSGEFLNRTTFGNRDWFRELTANYFSGAVFPVLTSEQLSDYIKNYQTNRAPYSWWTTSTNGTYELYGKDINNIDVFQKNNLFNQASYTILYFLKKHGVTDSDLIKLMKLDTESYISYNFYEPLEIKDGNQDNLKILSNTTYFYNKLIPWLSYYDNEGVVQVGDNNINYVNLNYSQQYPSNSINYNINDGVFTYSTLNNGSNIIISSGNYNTNKKYQSFTIEQNNGLLPRLDLSNINLIK